MHVPGLGRIHALAELRPHERGYLGDRVDGRSRLNRARPHELLAVLTGVHEDRGEPRAQGTANVRLNVVADHHGIAGRHAGIGQRLLEERCRRLATTVA